MSDFEPVTQDVLDLAKDIIEKHHEELLEARIGFIFRETSLRVSGKWRAAAISRIPAKEKSAGLELDYLVWLSLEEWDQMSTKQRRALVDHELCHAVVKQGKWSLRGHDIEEFTAIIDRYGLYSGALEQVATAVQPYLAGLNVLELHRAGAVLSVSPDVARRAVGAEG